MRLYGGLVLLAFFIGWVFYRLLIKRDLHKHKTQLQVGIFFLGAWGLIYWFLLS